MFSDGAAEEERDGVRVEQRLYLDKRAKNREQL
jgi:hypothetical protein